MIFTYNEYDVNLNVNLTVLNLLFKCAEMQSHVCVLNDKLEKLIKFFTVK